MSRGDVAMYVKVSERERDMKRVKGGVKTTERMLHLH
jgi:hypothetical protein